MNHDPTASVAHDMLARCPGTVLAVDLDGTLVHDDLLRRGLAQIARTRPIAVFALIGALVRGGRPGLKRAVARRSPCDPANLRYNTRVIGLARSWRARGRRVVLATAADEGQAQAIAAYLGLFDAVHASGQEGNLKGRRKAALLTGRYGARGFVYVGDSAADLHVWAKAGGAVIVSDCPDLHARLCAMNIPNARLTP